MDRMLDQRRCQGAAEDDQDDRDREYLDDLRDRLLLDLGGGLEYGDHQPDDDGKNEQGAGERKGRRHRHADFRCDLVFNHGQTA
jgi:hypothetical protein